MENVQLQESSPTFDKDGGQGRYNRDEDHGLKDKESDKSPVS